MKVGISKRFIGICILVSLLISLVYVISWFEKGIGLTWYAIIKIFVLYTVGLGIALWLLKKPEHDSITCLTIKKLDSIERLSGRPKDENTAAVTNIAILGLFVMTDAIFLLIIPTQRLTKSLLLFSAFILIIIGLFYAVLANCLKLRRKNRVKGVLCNP